MVTVEDVAWQQHPCMLTTHGGHRQHAGLYAGSASSAHGPVYLYQFILNHSLGQEAGTFYAQIQARTIMSK